MKPHYEITTTDGKITLVTDYETVIVKFDEIKEALTEAAIEEKRKEEASANKERAKEKLEELISIVGHDEAKKLISERLALSEMEGEEEEDNSDPCDDLLPDSPAEEETTQEKSDAEEEATRAPKKWVEAALKSKRKFKEQLASVAHVETREEIMDILELAEGPALKKLNLINMLNDIDEDEAVTLILTKTLTEMDADVSTWTAEKASVIIEGAIYDSKATKIIRFGHRPMPTSQPELDWTNERIAENPSTNSSAARTVAQEYRHIKKACYAPDDEWVADVKNFIHINGFMRFCGFGETQGKVIAEFMRSLATRLIGYGKAPLASDEPKDDTSDQMEVSPSEAVSVETSDTPTKERDRSRFPTNINLTGIDHKHIDTVGPVLVGKVLNGNWPVAAYAGMPEWYGAPKRFVETTKVQECNGKEHKVWIAIYEGNEKALDNPNRKPVKVYECTSHIGGKRGKEAAAAKGIAIMSIWLDGGNEGFRNHAITEHTNMTSVTKAILRSMKSWRTHTFVDKGNKMVTSDISFKEMVPEQTQFVMAYPGRIFTGSNCRCLPRSMAKDKPFYVKTGDGTGAWVKINDSGVGSIIDSPTTEEIAVLLIKDADGVDTPEGMAYEAYEIGIVTTDKERLALIAAIRDEKKRISVKQETEFGYK